MRATRKDWESCAATCILEPFSLDGESIKFRQKIGEGGAAKVFLVHINGREYALKLFAYTYSGNLKHIPSNEIIADSFTRECRAYAALIVKSLDGKATPRCYSWLTIDKITERYLARHFKFSESFWDKQLSGQDDPPVRGILMEYLRGATLDKLDAVTKHVTDEFYEGIKKIHSTAICHSNVKETNMLVEDGTERAVWLDFSYALTLPLPCYPPEQFPNYQSADTLRLEDVLSNYDSKAAKE
ncbi:hypothetical protein RUND412_000797 [Rhizina undulata]